MKCRDSNIRAMITSGVAELQRHGPREAVGGDGRAAFVCIAIEQMAWPVVVECVRAFKLAGLVEKKLRVARAFTRLNSSSL